jgi:hypothetical protein
MERTYSAPRLDKLGVRAAARVRIVGPIDPEFLAELADRTADVTELPDTSSLGPDAGTSGGPVDLVFLAADAPADLASLEALREAIRPSGAIWVVSRKGRVATLRDVEVIAAARAAGLVDNKVVAFSASHTALRLVIPRALR